MTVQQDFLGIKDLETLSPGKLSELHKALEDLLSSAVEVRRGAVDRLYAMDAHRRSPLAAPLLAYRLYEPDVELRTKIVQSINEIIDIGDSSERPPAKVRELLNEALRDIGEREVYCLLELLEHDDVTLEAVCLILNQCSSSCEVLVKLLESRDEKVSIRIAASRVIGHLGILEAMQVLEALKDRLTHRATGQLSMSFASHSVEEAKELLPTLRETLDILRDASI